MSTPLSMDLRRRIIARWKKGDISVDALADAFMVGRASVVRLIRLQRETGDVRPRPHGGGRKNVVDEKGRRFLKKLVGQNSDWTTYEFKDAFNAWAKLPVSRSTILRELKRMGFSSKKKASLLRNERPSASVSGSRATSLQSEASPLRVWFLWTKPARTRR
jgi:transposase